MIVIGENVMDNNALTDAPDPRGSFRYPRFYAPSSDSKLFFLALSIGLLIFPFFFSDKYQRLFFLGFAVLVDIAYLTYAFGSKITLYKDKIEYQTSFFFKRVIRLEQIVSWQLKLSETRAPVIFLLLKSGRKDVKDMVIEVNFKPDAAFYAWFPKLQTLVEERWKQFPALESISP